VGWRPRPGGNRCLGAAAAEIFVILSEAKDLSIVRERFLVATLLGMTAGD